MLQQKAFKKSNHHLTIWSYDKQEIVCTQKCTLSPVFGMIGVIKVQKRYSDNHVGGHS